MVPERGCLTLNIGNINALKSRDRHSAEILRNVGIIDINWVKNENEVEQYLCPSISCKARFVDLYLLRLHFFKIHNARPFKCTIDDCNWTFSTKTRLERHKEAHLNIKWFKCPDQSCGKKFSTSYNLKIHTRRAHGAKTFACTIDNCDATFRNKRSLELHIGTHENVKGSYSCTHEGCNKTFLTKNALSSHVRRHGYAPEDLMCSVEGCNKVFPIPCRLREHMRYHRGEKPYRCEHPGCNWAFFTGSKLYRHLNVHLQKRQFSCTVQDCNKSFNRSEHLNDHLLVHERRDPGKYPCPIAECGAKFAMRQFLDLHLLRTHKRGKGGTIARNRRNGRNIRTCAKKESNNYFDTEEQDQDRPETPNNQSIFEMDGEQQDQVLSESPDDHSISEVDSVNFLTGDFDMVLSSSETVPLSTHIPELVSSELLVTMNSIESPGAEALVDLSSIDSCISQAIVKTEETNNNEEAIVFSDNNVQYVFDHTLSIEYDSIKTEDSNGSARTDYTYTDVMNGKGVKTDVEDIKSIKWLFPTEVGNHEIRPRRKTVITSTREELENCKFSIPSDLVLGPGINDNQSLIVQDELYTQEDLQVLLLDQSSLKNSIFEHSTINLRDLE